MPVGHAVQSNCLPDNRVLVASLEKTALEVFINRDDEMFILGSQKL